MNTTPVVSAVIKALSGDQTMQARSAGSLFAQSEIDAEGAFESFARALTTEPTYATYEECRIEWVSGYLDIKPQAKGNSADAAFKRFKTRLVRKVRAGYPEGKTKVRQSGCFEKSKRERGQKSQSVRFLFGR
jgi:hypothetical protein